MRLFILVTMTSTLLAAFLVLGVHLYIWVGKKVQIRGSESADSRFFAWADIHWH